MPENYTVEYQRTRANLLRNPSFENALYTGSLTGSNASIKQYGSPPTLPALGDYYLYLTPQTTGNTNGYDTLASETRVIGGEAYTASAYVYVVSPNVPNIRIGIKFYDKDFNLLSTVWGADTPSSGFDYVRIALVNTTSPVFSYYAAVAIQYQRTGGHLSNQVWIDGLLLEQSSTLGDYFDPVTNDDAYWTGAAFDSPSALPTDVWATMSNVQQISGSIGRQQFVDTFEPSRMSITARYPNGYGNPNYSLRVGTLVRVKRVGAAYTMWTGRINNTTVEWGIPYDAATSNGVTDNVTIECEGALADWGRVQGNDLYIAPDDILTQLSNLLSGTGLQYGTTYTADNAPELSSSEVTDSLANWLNTAALTVGATIKDGSDNNIVGINGRDFVGGLPVRFSDQTASAFVQKYDNIVFDSVSADFFTEIELNTVDFGDIVVQYREAPYRTYRATTFSPSIAQAEDLANYLIGIYGDNGFGISEISCKSEAQTSWSMDLGYGWWDIIGYWTTVEFRGSTFRVVILGSSFTATPDESRFTYYVADIGLTPFLVLDDPLTGILDLNKLGW